MQKQAETEGQCCTIVVTDDEIAADEDLSTLLVPRDCSKEEAVEHFIHERVDDYYFLKHVRNFRMTISNYLELVIATYLLTLRDEQSYEINVFIHPAPLLHNDQLLENKKYNEMMHLAMLKSDSDKIRMKSLKCENDPDKAMRNERKELKRMLKHSEHLFVMLQGEDHCRGNKTIQLAKKIDSIISIAYVYHNAPDIGRIVYYKGAQ